MPPKVLVSNSMGSKYILQENGNTQGKTRLYNFIVRICDVKDDTSSNCKDSVVLDNVVSSSVY